MKSLALIALGATLLVVPPALAQADPIAEICQARASSESGYRGPRPGSSWQVGNTTFRLSGSVAIGLSYSKGPRGSNRGPGFFVGQGALERRADQAERRYRQIYTACMQGRRTR